MELSKIKPSERFIEILHPGTGEKIGIKVSLVSLKDERISNVRRKIQNKNLERETRRETITTEELENNSFHLVFNCMTSWDWYGDITFENTKPEFTEANVKKVFKELNWFQEQIEKALDDSKAFFPD